MTDPEQFEAGEVAAAEALDAEIDSVVTGRAPRRSDPTLLWLGIALRPPAPAVLHRRVDRVRRQVSHRVWRPVQVAAAVLGAILFGHAVSNLVNGSWVAESLGEAHGPHAYIEAGLALLGASLATAAGLWRRERLAVSVAAGVPLGLALGAVGVSELDEFAWGAALHLTEATAAVVLLVLWWRARRYARSTRTEEGS
jgi:hypothetical protein